MSFLARFPFKSTIRMGVDAGVLLALKLHSVAITYRIKMSDLDSQSTEASQANREDQQPLLETWHASACDEERTSSEPALSSWVTFTGGRAISFSYGSVEL